MNLKKKIRVFKKIRDFKKIDFFFTYMVYV